MNTIFRAAVLALVCLAAACFTPVAPPLDAGPGGGVGGAGGGSGGGTPSAHSRRTSRSSALAFDDTEQFVAALSPDSDRLVTFPSGPFSGENELGRLTFPSGSMPV